MKWAQAEQRHFKDYRAEGSIFTRRVLVSLAIVFLLFGVLVSRFYKLQVIDYADYLSQSDRNRIQIRPKPPNRGLIFDRHGHLLAENRPSFTLALVKEKVGDLEHTLDTIASIIELSEEERKSFAKALKQRRRPNQSIPVRFNLTEKEIALIAVNKYRLKGVEVKAELVRFYPEGELFAHTVGYVGRINERELKNFTEQDDAAYAGTHSIGKIGLEQFYEELLLGKVANEYIETDAHGRLIKVLDSETPEAGRNLYLHLDREIQLAAKTAMAERRGAVVAVDVKTGAVFAMLSTPSYDPNLFVTGISFKNYRALNESLDLPLFNRTIQGQYPPGSTLKPMLGLGGLKEQVIKFDTEIKDPGFYQLPNDDRRYREWKRGGHQDPVDLRKAITESCDIYFYDMAYKMGVDKMHAFGSHFGLGALTLVDVPNERRGIWPSREWKRKVRGLAWYPGNSLNMSIGQGDVLATPLQLAVMTGMLANRGTRYKPHIVARIGEEEVAPEVVDRVEVGSYYWDYVLSAMENVVHGARGTAKLINKGANYRMAGKTGTAQVIGIAQDERYDRDKIAERLRDHGLFVGFAPVDDPQIAVAVVVENGEHGSSAAAPVAREVFDAYFASQAKLELAQKEHAQNEQVKP